MIDRIGLILATPAAIYLSLAVDAVVLTAKLIAPASEAGSVLLAETAATARWITSLEGATP